MPLNAKLDKATYNAGDTMTLTVTTTAEERDRYVETPGTVNVSVPGVGEGVASFVLRRQTDDVSVSVSDPERQWALVSDDGVTAVYTATA